MLTSIGRAAARRVVSVNRTLTTGATATPLFVARPLAVRTFTTSQWSFQAVKAIGEKPAKKTKTTTKAKADKKAPAKPKKAATAKAKKSTAAKKKPAKKVVKKPVKKVKKPLSPERIEAQNKKAAHNKTKALLKTSLVREEPNVRVSAFNVFLKRQTEGTKSGRGEFAEIARKYHALSASEREALEQETAVQKAQREKDHQAWKESIPVEDIWLANNARKALRRAGTKVKKNNIEDERIPRKPLTAFNLFVAEDVTANGCALAEASAKWKNISESEKATYAPDYQKQLDEYSVAMDLIRDMAKLKLGKSKTEDKPILEKELEQ